jgi:autotransporter translocation and assembly factor TamB
MATEPNASARTPPKPRTRKRRVARALAITFALLVLATAAGIAFVASEAGLAIAARILIARSEGRLHIENPSGSLLSSIRIQHLEWRGP